MTRFAIVQRKGDLSTAGAAVSSFDVRKHREADRAFLGSGEYFGMAEFTAAPDGVLLVRELNWVKPLLSCFDGKILAAFHGRLSDGDTFHKSDRVDDPRFLRCVPIYTVGCLWEISW